MSEKKNFVEWTNELSVGIQEIDEQHKILIDLINRLFDEIIKGGNAEKVQEILDELVQYTIVHFSFEEALFRIFDYPDTQIHARHHVDLKHQVFELQEKVKSGGATVNTDLLLFLKKWLQNHILSEDKKYAPYLLKQGVKSTWDKKTWIGKIWGN